MLKILGDDLARICKNSMMFANPKSLWLPNEVLFDISDNTIQAFACDDYFAVAAKATLTAGKADTFFVLDAKDIAGYTKDKEKVEGLEEFARRNKKEELLLTVSKGYVKVSSNESELKLPLLECREDNWYIVEGLIFSDEVHPVSISGFDSNPERYAKLSQLKYDKNKEYISWNFVETESNHLLIRFTVGPNLSGVIRPLSHPPKSVDESTPEDPTLEGDSPESREDDDE